MACPLCGNSANRLRLPLAEAAIVECTLCHLLHTDPPRSGAFYPNPHDARTEDALQSMAKAPVFRQGLRMLSPLRANAVLDVGAATGIFLREAKLAGYDVCGVEPAGWQADWARSFGLEVKADLKDVTTQFDVVTMWDVLEHIPYPLDFLRDVRRVIRNGGYLLLRVPNGPYYLARSRLSRKRAQERLGVGEHVLHFSASTLQQALEKAHFRVLSIRNGPVEDVHGLRRRLKRSVTVGLATLGNGLHLTLGPSLCAVAQSLAEPPRPTHIPS